MTEAPLCGKVLRMVTVNIAAAENSLPADMHPTQAFADAAWRQNPHLSPSAYRSALGLTLSKVGIDLRTGADAAPLMAAGLNVLVGNAACWPQVVQAVRGWPGGREQLVVGLVADVTEGVQALAEAVDGLDVVWVPELDAGTAEGLETGVRDGWLMAYGLHGTDGLEGALAAADAATEQVWGRKKRSGLRALLVDSTLGKLEALTTACVTHKGEDVSAVEYASRMGWLVVAEEVQLVRVQDMEVDMAAPPVAPDAAAVTALEYLITAENAVAERLGGWPTIEQRYVFRAGALVTAGRLPWASAHEAAAWQAYIWPTLQAVFEHEPELLAAWQQMAPWAAHVGAVQAGLDAAQVAVVLQQAEPIFTGASPFATVLGVAGSLPGVAVVLAPGVRAADAVDVMTRPDVVDIGKLLGA